MKMKKVFTALSLMLTACIAVCFFVSPDAINALGDFIFSPHAKMLIAVTLPAGLVEQKRAAQAAVTNVQKRVAQTAIAYAPQIAAVSDFNLTIANASEVANDIQNAILFNAGSQVSSTYIGSQGADITVTKSGDTASYTNFLNQILNKPFFIKGFAYQVASVSQYNNTFTDFFSNGSDETRIKEQAQYIGQSTVVPTVQNQTGFNIDYLRQICMGYALKVGQNPASSSTLYFKTISESQFTQSGGRALELMFA